MYKIIRNILITFALLTLTSCGGGGGSDSESNSLDNSINNTNSISANKASINIEGFRFQDEFRFTSQQNNLSSEITINFVGDGVLAGVIPGNESALEWLDIREISSSSSHVTFNISVSEIEESYSARSTTLRFVTGDIEGTNIRTIDIPFNYNVGEYFYTDENEVNLIKIDGSTTGFTEKIELKTPNSNWSISSKPDWLDIISIDTTTVDFPSSITHNINISCNELTTSSQKNIGEVLLVDNLVDIPLSVNISCENIASKMIPEQYGLSLVQLNNIEKLNSNIVINSSANKTTDIWNASSNQSWLTVTNQGLSQTAIFISADTSNLADNQMHYADIVVTDNSNNNEQVIKVGLYKNTTLLAPSEEKILNITENISIIDPIRPYIYYQTSDQNDGIIGYTSFNAYNIYTDEIEYSIDLVANNSTCLQHQSISPDGTKVFFSDDLFCKNGSARVNPPYLAIYEIDLFEETPTIVELTRISPEQGFDFIDSNIGWSLDAIQLESIINNGYHALVLPNKFIFDSLNGNLIKRFSDNDEFGGPFKIGIKSLSNGNTFVTRDTFETNIYNLFISGSNSIYLDNKATFSYFSFDEEVGPIYIHPDADFISLLNNCFRLVDQEWSDNCDKRGLQYMATLPDKSILSSFWVSNDTLNSGIFSYNKEFNVIDKFSDESVFTNQQVSSDGIFAVGNSGYTNTNTNREHPIVKYIPLTELTSLTIR